MQIDRAHRSHSTREAKQNETNKKNQGSPIKTIKPHDSILVPLLGRGVFTAGFAPPRPYLITVIVLINILSRACCNSVALTSSIICVDPLHRT